MYIAILMVDKYPNNERDQRLNNANIELLAPAGSIDAANAALEYGADAIYLGLPKFSARAEATNFTEDEFYDTVGYAHSLDRRVYVTLNTVIKESELENLLSIMYIINKAGTDAVIVQDLGVLRLLRTHFPNLRLHASTQMAIHNKAGAEALLDLGVKRVTLARELGIPEIAEISSIEGLKSESFLHGALCYSYSGLCMYSSMQTGRSANRGRCAYSCREVFSCNELDLRGHAFSLRDLSLIEHIDGLLASGVDSLKIEGRKKSALYVAAVVKLYRGIIDKRDSEKTIKQNALDLQTIFSRQSCSFFAGGESSKEGRSGAIDTQAVGHRGANIGSIMSITRHGKFDRVNFKTSQDFEKHDGIQIDIPDEQRPFGFPVNELFKVMPDGRAKPTFIVEKGTLVSIVLPTDHPDLPIGSAVYLASSQRIKRELKWHTPKAGEHRERYPVDIELNISKSNIDLKGTITSSIDLFEPITLSTIFASEDDFSPANNPDQTEGAAKKVFNKTGATPFTLNNIELTGETTLFIPSSIMNNLRREFYEELSTKLEDVETEILGHIYTKAEESKGVERSTNTSPEWIIKTDNPISLFTLNQEIASKFSEVIVEINENVNPQLLSEELEKLQTVFSSSIIRIALPAICRNSRLKNVKKAVEEMFAKGYLSWQISNLWGLQLLKTHNPTSITGSSTLYNFNHESIDEQLSLGLDRVTLSIEDGQRNLEELIKLRGHKVALTTYQDVPLFIGEACSYSSFNNGCLEDCKEINNNRLWEDTRGNSYLLNKKGCRTVLINTKPFSLAGYLRELEENTPKYYQADFINRNYTATEIERILSSLFLDEHISNTHPGNFERELL